MINRIIDFSVEHKLAVLAVIAVACIAGWWAMVTLPLDATPDLSDTQVIILFALGPQSGYHRGPGHLSDRHRHAWRAAGQDGAGLLRFRLLLRVRHF